MTQPPLKEVCASSVSLIMMELSIEHDACVNVTWALRLVGLALVEETDFFTASRTAVGK